MKIVWLRNAGDADDECWVPCAKNDPGSLEFKHGADVWANRQIEDLQRMCESLIAEKHARAHADTAGVLDNG